MNYHEPGVQRVLQALAGIGCVAENNGRKTKAAGQIQVI
jgi:hypothetical protein